jgi:hypothetical protein
MASAGKSLCLLGLSLTCCLLACGSAPDDGAGPGGVDGGPSPAAPPTPAAPVSCAMTVASGLMVNAEMLRTQPRHYLVNWQPDTRVLAVDYRFTVDGTQVVGTDSFTLDASGGVKQQQSIQGGVVTSTELFDLDAAGFVTTGETLAEGRSFGNFRRENRYDSAGRLQSWVYRSSSPSYQAWNGATGRLERDGDGRIVRRSLNNPNATERLEERRHSFDAEGRLATTEWRWPGYPSIRATYQYDSAGRMTRAEVQGYFGAPKPPPEYPVNPDVVSGRPNHVTDYRYDSQGRIESLRAEGLTHVTPPQFRDMAFSPGCEALRARFPTLFQQPDAALEQGFVSVAEPGNVLADFDLRY